MFNLHELLDSLQVEQLDKLLFRGYSLRLPLPQIFGGQVLAQSINSALRTVEPDRHLHSFHSYFLRPGDDERSIIFEVDLVRDGGSFTTRKVVAKQNGKPIFICSLSFQTSEGGFEHQIDMPDGVPQPETLETEDELWRRRIECGDAKTRPFILPPSVVDLRRTNPEDLSNPQNGEPVHGYWFKFNGEIADDPVIHQTLLTYVSDFGLLSTGLRPHRQSAEGKKLQIASLDHAMWFHDDFRVNDWVYYHMDSPRSGYGRDFNRGSLYLRDGRLIASCTQEGLIRSKS